MTLVLLVSTPASAGPVDTFVYNVSARIDGGGDFLILHRNTVQWHHTGGVAAPGRQGGTSDDPTTISATLNGATTMNAVAWLPAWSQPFPNQIRFEDTSSLFTPLNPPLPAADVSVTVTTFSGRGAVTLEQFPTAANDYTLIAKFADGFNGAAFTAGQITVVVPEPGLAVIAVLGIAAARGPARRRGSIGKKRKTVKC
jgi:hypothetical protein